MRPLAAVACAFVALALTAPVAQAEVRPGAMTTTAGAQCTSNFVFTDGSATYLGQAAHCSSTGAATETNGCDAGVRPIGTPVRITGASQPGTLAYNSWNAMQAAGERDADACDFNDFALVRLSPQDAAAVNPTVPKFGGPHGVGTATAGSTTYSWQNSPLRAGIALLSPKTAIVLARDPSGWSYTVTTLTPGIPGDSGSGYLTSSGKAFGVLSTLQVLPIPLSNGVSDLGKALDYARAHGVPGLRLVDGRTAFRPSLLGLT